MNQENKETASVDPIKLAFNKAKAYKESIKSNSDEGNLVKESNVVDGGKTDVSASVKIAMEKAKTYKQQNKGVAVNEIDQGNTYR